MDENIGKNIVGKHSQKSIDHAEKQAADILKAASKREIQKIAEKTGDFIGN